MFVALVRIGGVRCYTLGPIKRVRPHTLYKIQIYKMHMDSYTHLIVHCTFFGCLENFICAIRSYWHLTFDIDTLTTIHICVDVHIVQYKSISLYKYPDGTLESLYNH